MHLSLQMWIIENYTKEGETILDPMAGSGTILVACSMGRNVICVELEQKFVRMMEGNWQKIQQRGPQLGYQMGEAQILQGDARNLQGILVDKCIFSPPYTNRMDGGIRGSRAGMTPYTDESPDAWYTQRDQTNIGNLPYGSIDAVISSPPYEAGASGPSRSPFWERLAKDPTSARFGRKKHPSIGESYSQVDAVISSPPYGLGEGLGHSEKQESKIRREKYAGWLYGNNDAQIGNLTADSYLKAILQVYKQCYSVLKPDGLMVLVTKNFIRDKKIVPLDEDTIKLCEQAGFTFIERHYRKLTAQSFWRTIYYQKYPDAPVLDKEDVLIFRKEDKWLEHKRTS